MAQHQEQHRTMQKRTSGNDQCRMPIVSTHATLQCLLLLFVVMMQPQQGSAFLPWNHRYITVNTRYQQKTASLPQHRIPFTQQKASSYIPDPMNNRHSASDWLYNVRSLPESKVLREIRNPVLSVFVWSLCVSTLHALCARSPLLLLRSLAQRMCIPGTAHSFLVSALGLLLVFRTNSAYQRFNEGRKIWEHILSVSRNMSRMIQLYQTEIGSERQRRIMNLVAAYPYLLRQHIRPGCLCSNNSPDIPEEYRLLLKEQRRTQQETRHEGQPYKKLHASSEDDEDAEVLHSAAAAATLRKEEDAEHQPTNTESDCWVDKRALPWSLFMPESLPAIARAENRPLWVCDRMAALICKIPYGPNFTSRERLVLLGMVDKLTNAIGQCERIHQTAVPLNYARHSLRSLTLWLFTLPFALVQDLGLLTAFANAVIAWLFFGVYQIGYSIEDPFQGSLRLSILCDAIRRSVTRQPSSTYPDEDSAYQLSPEECQNIYGLSSSNDSGASSNPNMPPECAAVWYNEQNADTGGAYNNSVGKKEETRRLNQKENDFKVLQQMVWEHGQSLRSNGTAEPENASSSKTIWTLDEEMLATPKIVTLKNGTWTELGI